jgi:hypothetical protein
MASTWQIGPMGDLRSLPGAEPEIDMPIVRYGGIHQGLSGARQIDITGFRQNITLNFEALFYEDWAWLEAIYRRLIPGPHYLINPMRKNLLVAESSFPKVGGGTARGSGILGGATLRTADWPTGVGAGGWACKWTNRSGAAWFRLARNNPAAVNPTQQVTMSAYIKGSTATNMRWIVDYYDRSGQNGASAYTADIPVTTAWTRVSHTITVPAGIGGLDPVIYVADSTPDILIAATQLEVGAAATSWELGGGSMKAIVEQMPTVSPVFPLTDVSVSILEA